MFVWVVDALLDYYFFYDGTFWELFIYDVPNHEVYIRLVILISFTIFGIIIANMMAKRKQAADALRDNEERYRSFVQNFRGIAFRGRMDFTPIFFHGAAEKNTGYTEREFLDGKPRWDQVIHPEDLPALLAEDEESLHSIPHYSYEREYRIVRKDGAVRWVHDFSVIFR